MKKWRGVFRQLLKHVQFIRCQQPHIRSDAKGTIPSCWITGRDGSSAAKAAFPEWAEKPGKRTLAFSSISMPSPAVKAVAIFSSVVRE